MPRYKIDQYEVCTFSYEVEGKSEAHAIKKVLEGEAQPLDCSLKYLEICHDLGLPVEAYPELADALMELGVDVDESIIPSIRSIELVEELNENGEEAVAEVKQSLMNFYRCFRCGHEWQFRSTLCHAVYHDCPECNTRHISPYWYERSE